MKNVFLVALLCFSAVQLYAQSPLGKWKTIDHETGDAESYVTIYEKDGKLFGSITQLLIAEHKGAVCTKCKGVQQNQAIEGMEILTNLEKDGSKWQGEVLDVKSGKVYSCQVKVKSDEELELRAYIGAPFLGKTLHWYRAE